MDGGERCRRREAGRSPAEPCVSRCTPLGRFQGTSRAVRRLRSALARVSPREAPVLLVGESGTGKEVAARVIHELSTRSAGPFVPVDCGAFSEGVLESELFGHARGAFTHAVSSRSGLLEAADGGTLLLDEIANTTLAFQARLLRALQEREVRPVGSNARRRIDVRVLAASNRDLSAEVRRGAFREDLFYRLDVLRVRLPRLAERVEDIPVLCDEILREMGEHGGEQLRLTPRARAALLLHGWPGNVRELRNVLESAAAFSPEGAIDVAHLPERFGGGALRQAGASLRELVDAFERSVLTTRLEAHGWNRTRAARALGITRRCLFDKLAKHGLSPPR